MPLKLTLALLKAALVIGAVILLDHMIRQQVPPLLMYFLPAWVWLLPREGVSHDT